MFLKLYVFILIKVKLMEKGTKQVLGWANVILGALVALTLWLAWPAWLAYLWALLIVLGGVWQLTA